MVYANSENIFIFPVTVARDQKFKEKDGRTLTEYNLSTLAEKIAGTPSCIIDYAIADADSKITRIDFILNGRYISLTDEKLLNTESNLYVAPQIDSNGCVQILDQIRTDGKTYEMQGISFYTESSDITAFQLIDNGKICERSFRKATCQVIDGGEI